MGRLVPPRHRHRAIYAAVLVALAALLALLPGKAHGQLPTTSLPSTTDVSVPTLPTDTTVSVPTTTVTVPSVTVPSTTLPSTTLPGSGGSTTTPGVTTPGATTPGTTATLPGTSLSLGSGGSTTPGGTTSNSGGSNTGSSGGGGFSGGSGGGGATGTSGGSGGGGNATAAGLATVPSVFGGGSGGGSGAGGGGGIGGGPRGAGGSGGGGGSTVLGIPIIPIHGGTPGVTPLAALLASTRLPNATDRGVVGDVGHAITQIVNALPDWSRPIIALLLALVVVLLVRSFLSGRRARKLDRQRQALEGDVAALQTALVADVPERLSSLAPSVAYRSADGPATGGDFYDAFQLPDGRVAVMVGDASGHGREAIARAASVRYSLRAYLDAGLEPNAALRVAGRALESGSLDGDFATAVAAVYDPQAGTLSYSCAGHPPPIVTGAAHRPVTAGAAPPIGWGVPTGDRLTTIPLPAGALACFFTDGLIEARKDGELFARERLVRMIEELHPDDGAEALLDHVRRAVDEAGDDMATLVVRATETPAAPGPQVEELEIEPPDLTTGAAQRFLEACGVPAEDAESALAPAEPILGEHGAAVVRVALADPPTVKVSPPGARAVEPGAPAAPAAEERPKISTE
jgi:hypothetical protein